MTRENGGRRRGRWWPGAVVGVVGCALAVTAAAGTVLAWLGVEQYGAEQATTAPPPSVITARVTEGRLEQAVPVTVTFSRGVEYALTQPDLPEGRTGVVSGVVPETGSTVAEGDVVLSVGLRPLIVLEGQVPMVRDLAVGARGADVRAVQEALARLGQDVTADGTLGTDTMLAVREVYRDRDLQPMTASGQESRSDTPVEELVLPRGELAFVPTLPARVDRCAPLGTTLRETAPCVLLVGEPEAHALLTAEQADQVTHGALVRVDVTGEERELPVSGPPELVPDSSEVADGEGGDEGSGVDAAPGSSEAAADQRVGLALPEGLQLPTANRPGTLVVERDDGAGLLVPATALADSDTGTRVTRMSGGRATESGQPVGVEVGLCVAGTCSVTPVDGELAEGDSVLLHSASDDD